MLQKVSLVAILRLNKKNILIAIVSFILGVVLMYFYNWKWIINSKTLTEDLVVNFRDTYDIQEKLSQNYSDAYNLLVDCLVIKKNECKVDEITKDFEKIQSERNQLKLLLEQHNQKAEAILNKFPQKND